MQPKGARFVLSDNPPSEPDLPKVKITDQILTNLLQEMKASPERSFRLKRKPSLGRNPLPFGSVYSGVLPGFGDNRRHYAMARCMEGVAKKGPPDPDAFGPAFPFSPITSKKQSGSPVLTLPPNTLPPKRGKHGEHLLVHSQVLLFWRLLIRRRVFDEKLHYVKRLEEKYRQEAERLLEVSGYA